MENALAVVDREVPLAPITLPELIYLADGSLDEPTLVKQLRRRRLAGDRGEWPDIPEFLAIRQDLMGRALTD